MTGPNNEEMLKQQKEDEEFDAGFDMAVEGEKDPEGKPVEDPQAATNPDEQVPANNVSQAPDPENVTPEQKPVPAPATPAPAVNQEGERNLQKALSDTKAWGTKLSMRVNELETELEKYRSGKSSAADVDAARAAVKDAEKAMMSSRDDVKKHIEKLKEDYPGMEAVLEPLLESVSAQRDELNELKSKSKSFEESQKRREEVEQLRNYFETSVLPEVKKAHPDVLEHIGRADTPYFEWAKLQSPAMQYAAMQSNDPRDIIMAVGEFKKFTGSGAAAKMADEDKKKAAAARAASASIRGGSSRPPGFQTPEGGDAGKSEEQQYDEGFNLSTKK